MSGTIVVGVDGSEASKRALSMGGQPGRDHGLEPRRSQLVGTDLSGRHRPRGKGRKALEKILDEVLGDERAEQVRLVLVAGRARAPSRARVSLMRTCSL